MKINVTMFKNVPGCEKPILDFAIIEAENIWEDALGNAMEFFHVSGKSALQWPVHLIDENGEIIGVINKINGDDGAKYRFLLEEVY